MNPFLVSGYKSPEYFCNREKETARMMNAIENLRNVTLVSERRLGKTGLLKHVEYLLDKKIIFIYVDLYPSLGLKDFIQLLSNEVLKKLEPFSEKVIRKITGFFSFVKPKFSFDPQSGAPDLEFNIGTRKEAEQTLGMLFAYLRESGKKAVVAFDEFQQILKYPEKNMEALIRTEIQKDTNTCFIYSGSQTHLVLSMFKEQSGPFYQSTEIFPLKKIEKADYTGFMAAHFSENNYELSESVADYIYELNNGITFNVQFICNRIFSAGEKTISKQHVDEILGEILTENEIVYYNYRELITELQHKIVKAVAREHVVEKPFSSEFIDRYNLKSTSSVKSAIKILINKGILTSHEGLHVSDLYFSKWLSKQI